MKGENGVVPLSRASPPVAEVALRASRKPGTLLTLLALSSPPFQYRNLRNFQTVADAKVLLGSKAVAATFLI